MSDFKIMKKKGGKDDSGEATRRIPNRMSETSDFEKGGNQRYPRKTIRKTSSPTPVVRGGWLGR